MSLDRATKELMAASPHETEITRLPAMPNGLIVDTGATETPINSFEIDVKGWSILQWGVLWGDTGTAGAITVEGRAYPGEGSTTNGTTAATRGWTPVVMYRDDSLTSVVTGASSAPAANATHRYVADVSAFEIVRFRVSTALTNTMRQMYYKLLSRHESLRKSNAAPITSSVSASTLTGVHNYGFAKGGVGATAWPSAATRELKSASSRSIVNVFLRHSGSSGNIYVRLYDKPTAPVAGDEPLTTIVCAPGEEKFIDYGISGLWCPTGVGVAITGGAGVSDNTAPPAGGVLRIRTGSA